MKLDLAKTLKTFYTATAKPQRLTLTEAPFLTISGQGDPNGEHFLNSIQALYTAAYTIKGHYKQQQQDFTVCKLEGLWWADSYYLETPREEWRWQLLIRMPDYLTELIAQQSIEKAIVKKQLPLLHQVALIHFEEGDCVQIMHTGPYSNEPATLEILHGYMEAHQLRGRGKHHEIYLSDPHKTAPEKMRTILRHGVE